MRSRLGIIVLGGLVGLLALAVGTVAVAQEYPQVKGEHLVVVTVDDLPIPSRQIHPTDAEREQITHDLLAVLRKHHIQAVAFVVGKNIGGAADERLLDLWLEAGHELGSHTQSHLDYSKTAPEDYIADCETGRTWLERFLAQRKRPLRFFRFPFLREGDTLPKVDRMRQWLAEKHLRNLPVTIDGQDWSFEGPWVTARQAGDVQRLETLGRDYQTSLRLEALTYTSDGDQILERPTPQVLLVHANEVGAAQWDGLFTWMEAQGFRFVPADDVIADSAIASLPRFASRFGGSHWYRIRHERREARAQEQVRVLLTRQAEAWSRGDLDGFCSAYAEDVVFVSPSGVTRGRQAVLDRYKARYPDRNAMGSLHLEVQEVRTVWGPEVSVLGDALPGAIHGASVVARWSIERTEGANIGGSTLLVLERVGDTWRIVSDASM